MSAALPGQASIQMHSYDIAIKILALVPCVIDFVVDLRIDCSAMTEMSRDRETCCRKEVCREAQR